MPTFASPKLRACLAAALLGLLGASVGVQEGIEINVLGLNFGLDLNSVGFRLPFIGRIGLDDTTVSHHP